MAYGEWQADKYTVALWQMANTNDVTGNHNLSVGAGTPAQATGWFGNAYYYGTNTACYHVSSVGADFTWAGAFCLEILLKLASFTTAYCRSIRDHATTASFYLDYNKNTQSWLWLFLGSTYSFADPLQWDTWCYLVFLRDAQNYLRCYRNGKEKGTAQVVSGTCEIASGLRLGACSSSYYANTTIDACRVRKDYAPSAREIRQTYAHMKGAYGGC